MKKRLKGLFSLCLALCFFMSGMLTGEVFAVDYSFDGSSIYDSGFSSPEKLFAGDTLSAAYTGGFVVLNESTGEVLETAGAVHEDAAAYYDDGTGNFVKNDKYYYFAEQDPNALQYVVPQTDGYQGYRVSSVFNTQDSSSLGEQYCTFYGTRPGEAKENYPVYFVYLRPIPNTYTVQFDANYTGAAGTMADQTFNYGEVKALNANAYSVTGYSFQNWSTESDGSGVVLADGADGSVFATSENNATVKLYAQWAPITYSVKFVANGGEGTMEAQTFTYGTEQKLTKNTFTYNDHTFEGWNTEADGSGTSYTDEQAIGNLSDTLGTEITLYAQWKEVEEETPNPGGPGEGDETPGPEGLGEGDETPEPETETPAPEPETPAPEQETPAPEPEVPKQETSKSDVTEQNMPSAGMVSPKTGDNSSVSGMILVSAVFCLVILLHQKKQFYK